MPPTTKISPFWRREALQLWWLWKVVPGPPVGGHKFHRFFWMCCFLDMKSTVPLGPQNPWNNEHVKAPKIWVVYKVKPLTAKKMKAVGSHGRWWNYSICLMFTTTTTPTWGNDPMFRWLETHHSCDVLLGVKISVSYRKLKYMLHLEKVCLSE